MRNRLVITGCGAVGPAGMGVEPLWHAVASGRCLAQPLTDDRFAGLPLRSAGIVPPQVARRFVFPESRVASLMLLAAQEAIANAGWDSETLSDVATGLCAATSKGDVNALTGTLRTGCSSAADIRVRSDAVRRSPEECPHGHTTNNFALLLPSGPGDLVADELSIHGPRISPVAACATGTHALIRAAQLIRHGDARRALVVAGDASIIPLLLGAFDNMGVLTADACRPFDANRSGFFISEGAAAVTIEAAADAAGQPIVELAGWLTGGDPTGLTAQDATGETLAAAIRILLARSAISLADADLYSAHGTATASNDLAEARAIHAVFLECGDRVAAWDAIQCPYGHTTNGIGPRVFAAKSTVGHLLGAAGLTEAVIAIQAMRHGIVPPIPTLRTLDPECAVRVAASAESLDIRTALCTSLGFGGQIGLLALRRPSR